MKRRRNRLLAERVEPPAGQARPPRPGERARVQTVRSVTVNLAESPLGWLRSRDLVSARQFAAGEKLRDEWERAQLSPSVTMRWDAPPMGKVARGAPACGALTDGHLTARRRFEAAVAAVGAGLGDILWRVVCAGEGMREAERALGWPARAGKLVLTMALDRLAGFYRLR
jgi:hypothetical protein